MMAWAIFSFYLACSVPAGFITPNTLHVYNNYSYDQVIFHPDRTCRTTGLPKLARSKYCPYMKCNVSRMDHFCPWVNQAVGEENYRFFLFFLFTNVMVIGYAAVCMGLILASVVHDKKLFQAQFVQGGGKRGGGGGQEVTSASTMIVLQYLLYTEVTTVCVLILTASMAFVLLCFLGYHLSLVFRGMTTNESYKWGEVSDYHKRIIKAHLAVVGFVESGELDEKVLAADPAVARKEGGEEGEGGEAGEAGKKGQEETKFFGRHDHGHDHGHDQSHGSGAAAAAAVAPSAFFAQPTASAVAAGAANGGGGGGGGGGGLARKSGKDGAEDEENEEDEEDEEDDEGDEDEDEEPQFELSAIPQPSSSSSSSPRASGAAGGGGKGGGGDGGSERVAKRRPSLEAAVPRWRKEVAAGARLHYRSLPPLGALLNHPGPLPENIYNMGAWANLMEVGGHARAARATTTTAAAARQRQRRRRPRMPPPPTPASSSSSFLPPHPSCSLPPLCSRCSSRGPNGARPSSGSRGTSRAVGGGSRGTEGGGGRSGRGACLAYRRSIVGSAVWSVGQLVRRVSQRKRWGIRGLLAGVRWRSSSSERHDCAPVCVLR